LFVSATVFAPGGAFSGHGANRRARQREADGADSPLRQLWLRDLELWGSHPGPTV